MTAEHPDGQSTLFVASSWKQLREKFPAAYVERQTTATLDQKLKTVESLAAKGKIKAALKEAEIEEAHAKRKEKSALFLCKHALKLLVVHQYLFNDEVDESEQDYIVKCLGACVWVPCGFSKEK